LLLRGRRKAGGGAHLVLLDEPLGALDKQLREQMQYELKQLHERLGVTIVYVTHDQSEALTMSDRIAVFRDGAIEQLAAPTELYERPQTPYVAQFIGDQLRGTVDGALASGQCRVRLDDGLYVIATAVSALQPGDRCLLSVRPERIAVGEDTSGQNRFSGQVEGLVYLGEHLRLRFHIGGLHMVAKIPNKTGSAPTQRGEQVTLSWAAQDCRAFSLRSDAVEDLQQENLAVAAEVQPAWLPATPLTNW
jgi:putative spermidine/putrescine transport system ATP-binding protein